jgi:predicted PurR-regulated permease PerM
MKMIFAAIIAFCLVVTIVLFFVANRVDYKRRVKGWNGTPFSKAEYSGSKRTSRLLRTSCLVLLAVAALAFYGFLFFG